MSNNSTSNKSYTINTEDGGMVTEACNTFSTFDSVNITISDAYYGCYTHVEFNAPNTNSQPFVLRIESQMDDISTKFGTFKKSWGFGNLSITPLGCSNYSNIIPLKSPIILSTTTSDDETLSNNELTSLKYNYLFMLINVNDSNISNGHQIEINLLLGSQTNYSDYYWHISMDEFNCKLENKKESQIINCMNDINYIKLIKNISFNSAQQVIWISWDPFNVNSNERTFSFGAGSQLDKYTIASLPLMPNGNSYGDLDYITFMAPINSNISVTISPIQFSMPKICLSQLYESNKIDLHHTWIDDCSEKGWELRKYSHIIQDKIYLNNESIIEQCQITDLNTNNNNMHETQCFHGPFTGSKEYGTDINDFGDYISRYFYVFTDVEYDIISVSLLYYGLCTWNPEQYENDTAYVFVNNKALWKSAPQYEFVNEYCQGYSLYSDWILYLDYENILNPQLIQCLYLLDQICAYPVQFTFRHTHELQSYFSIGIGAKLNQAIGNEAFGFSNVKLTYKTCADITSMPIGNIAYSIKDLNRSFHNGDMLIINSDSEYYLVAERIYNDSGTYDNNNNNNNNNNVSHIGCSFTLFGGYKMWQQFSENCTIAGLPIMINYPLREYIGNDKIALNIEDDGFLSFSVDQKQQWARRTPCVSDHTYAYYSINKTNSIGHFGNEVQDSLYSVDCAWAMVIKNSALNVIKINTNDGDHDHDDGEHVWSMGNNIEKLVFEGNGDLVLYDDNDNYIQTLSEKAGADFLIFDAGKLALIDYDNHEIVTQYDFELAQCETSANNDLHLKYFYFMKPGDILWNGEALISPNCQYKLILINGNLNILNGNVTIWQKNLPNNEIVKAEKFEFQKDGNMILYSYANNEILWQTDTSTFFEQDTIFYADRAILNNDGQFFIIDNATLTVREEIYMNNMHFTNGIETQYNENMDCESDKYSFIDKRYGFYATWVSYYNCLDNTFVFNQTTPCILYKYCPIIRHYENIFLTPTGLGESNNCRKYLQWRSISNNYILFQVSFTNTETSVEPELYLVLSTSENIQFNQEFDSDYTTLLVIISFVKQSVTLQTKYNTQIFFIETLFEKDEKEWIWIEWDVNFDYIAIGNSHVISKPSHTAKYSKFFHKKLNRNEYLFNYLNLAWKTNKDECHGTIVVQFTPLDVEIPKSCISAPYQHQEEIINNTFNNTLNNTLLLPNTTNISSNMTQIISTVIFDNDDSITKTDSMSIIVMGIAALSLMAAIIAVIILICICKKRKNKKKEIEFNDKENDNIGIEMVNAIVPTQTQKNEGNETAEVKEHIASDSDMDDFETLNEIFDEMGDEKQISLKDVKRQKSVIEDDSDIENNENIFQNDEIPEQIISLKDIKRQKSLIENDSDDENDFKNDDNDFKNNQNDFENDGSDFKNDENDFKNDKNDFKNDAMNNEMNEEKDVPLKDVKRQKSAIANDANDDNNDNDFKNESYIPLKDVKRQKSAIANDSMDGIDGIDHGYFADLMQDEYCVVFTERPFGLGFGKANEDKKNLYVTSIDEHGIGEQKGVVMRSKIIKFEHESVEDLGYKQIFRIYAGTYGNTLPLHITFRKPN